MQVLFIQDNPLDESQALIELAAFLGAAGHPCTLLLDRVEPDLVGAAREVDPGLVVVACSMLNHGWARDAIGRLRTLGAPIVVGGTAPTLFPRLLVGAGMDFIVRGEAEGPIMGLVEAIEGGTDLDGLAIPGLSRPVGDDFEGEAAGPGVELGDAPMALKGLYYDRYPFMRSFPFKRFLSSRGCHHGCLYCYISKLNKVQPRGKGRRWTRRKDPEMAVEEVARELAAGPLRHVHFSDDLFTNDAQWLATFAPLYRRRVGVPFTCNTSAELIDDGVAASLAEAGCFAAGFAVETSDDQLRNKVLRKGVTTDHMRAAARHLHHHGVKLATFNMIALPGETPEQALETAGLNADLQTHFVRINYAFPMPGTGMCDHAVANGLLPPDWEERFSQPGYRYVQGPQFDTPYRREFENLFVLFRTAASNRGMMPFVRRALSVRTPRALKRMLTLQGAWNEKRVFRIPIVAGLRFFVRVGRPELRATNFPALI